MTTKRTKKTKTTLDNLKETTTKEIETCRIMIGFYEKLAESMSPEEKGKTLLKVDKIKGSLKFNESFNDYLNTL